MSDDPRKQAKQIAQLEDSFCNPRKLSEARELREDLKAQGYTDRQIDEMADER